MWERALLGGTHLYMGIHPKSYRIFPKKVAATLLNDSRRMQLEHSSHIHS